MGRRAKVVRPRKSSIAYLTRCSRSPIRLYKYRYTDAFDHKVRPPHPLRAVTLSHPHRLLISRYKSRVPYSVYLIINNINQ